MIEPTIKSWIVPAIKYRPKTGKQCQIVCTIKNRPSTGQRCRKPASGKLLLDGVLTWLCSPHMGMVLRQGRGRVPPR